MLDRNGLDVPELDADRPVQPSPFDELALDLWLCGRVRDAAVSMTGSPDAVEAFRSIVAEVAASVTVDRRSSPAAGRPGGPGGIGSAGDVAVVSARSRARIAMSALHRRCRPATVDGLACRTRAPFIPVHRCGGKVAENVEPRAATGRRRIRNRAGVPARSRLPAQRPFAQPRRLHAPTEIASADQIEMIHEASLRILRDIGMRVLDDETRSLLAAAGAAVAA
jgi:hypothetical protein